MSPPEIIGKFYFFRLVGIFFIQSMLQIKTLEGEWEGEGGGSEGGKGEGHIKSGFSMSNKMHF